MTKLTCLDFTLIKAYYKTQEEDYIVINGILETKTLMRVKIRLLWV